MYIIESGKVRIFVLSESGHEISVRIFGPGDMFGELSVLDGLPRSAGAIAMEETHVMTLRREDLQSLLKQYPQIALGIITALTGRIRYTTDYAETFAFLDVDGRVAKRLLELAAQYGLQTAQGTEIDLRLTQGDLASLVGATRERINKVLGFFRDEGLVDLDAHKVIILDPSGLQRKIVY
jgi:CRP-like cAMP-binding protein